MCDAEENAGRTDGGVEAAAEVRAPTAVIRVTVTLTPQATALTLSVCVCVSQDSPGADPDPSPDPIPAAREVSVNHRAASHGSGVTV